MSKRLEILTNSLQKKELLFDSKFSNHIKDVERANGQPLNDKRNGQATLSRWDKQSDSLRNMKKEIEKTKLAIEEEQYKIAACTNVLQSIPAAIIELIEDGALTQWRKYPNMFFVNGVDKARIIWDAKKRILSHNYVNTITDKDQYRKFASTFNGLKAKIA